MLKKRHICHMGYDATNITLGGCGVGKISQEKADKAVELALRCARASLIFIRHTLEHRSST